MVILSAAGGAVSESALQSSQFSSKPYWGLSQAQAAAVAELRACPLEHLNDSLELLVERAHSMPLPPLGSSFGRKTLEANLASVEAPVLIKEHFINALALRKRVIQKQMVKSAAKAVSNNLGLMRLASKLSLISHLNTARWLFLSTTLLTDHLWLKRYSTYESLYIEARALEAVNEIGIDPRGVGRLLHEALSLYYMLDQSPLPTEVQKSLAAMLEQLADEAEDA